MGHIVIQKGFRFEPRKVSSAMSDYHFDESKGYWASNSDGSAMIRSAAAPKPTTKKADVETGEDKKGQ